MERADWLRDRRRAAEERMDTLWAPIYDERWGATIDPSHRSFVERALLRCPPGSRILDAGCGTGKYWPLLLADGRSLLGVDQSAGMLAEAHRKYPDVQTQKLGLQELAFEAAFDAIVCIDAMEYVFPEDWPRVLANFRRAIRHGPFYFTVELPDVDLEAAFRAARAEGLPVVEGELYQDGGYHYYPPIERVRAWTDVAGFRLLEEGVGDDYHHFLWE